MGLDISAYSEIEYKEDYDESKDHGYFDELTYIPSNGDYYPLQQGSLKPGMYTFSDCHSFRAGSYGGYNVWREELAKLAGYEPSETSNGEQSWALTAWHAEEGPFWELINFSDCEGVICSEVAKKLLGDFQTYEFLALEQDAYFINKYNDFFKACELASEDGCIVFC